MKYKVDPYGTIASSFRIGMATGQPTFQKPGKAFQDYGKKGGSAAPPMITDG
jgi:hypothetical protein